MTYVTEQTPEQLRAHMRRLKKLYGWHDPLADSLYKEILRLDTALEQARAALAEREREVANAKADALKSVAEWHEKQAAECERIELSLQKYANDSEAMRANVAKKVHIGSKDRCRSEASKLREKKA